MLFFLLLPFFVSKFNNSTKLVKKNGYSLLIFASLSSNMALYSVFKDD